MILISDTRQQEGQHKNIDDYCKRTGITIVRKKLDVGDYMFPESEWGKYGKISVDSKASILELCKNVASKDHRRFRNECIKAQSEGIRLIILVEELPPFGRLDMWVVSRFRTIGRYHKIGDPMTLVSPSMLRKACITMQEKYGVRFRFCTRRQSPARIIKYLKGELE